MRLTVDTGTQLIDTRRVLPNDQDDHDGDLIEDEIYYFLSSAEETLHYLHAPHETVVELSLSIQVMRGGEDGHNDKCFTS